VKRVVATLLLLLVSLLGSALAQQCLNYVAVNGKLLPGNAACYFTRYGDHTDAFVDTTTLAKAMGFTAYFDTRARQLRLTQGALTVTLAATADIAQGLKKQPGTLTVNGKGVSSPMAILLSGSSFVPLGSVVSAFGAKAHYDAKSRVIMIETLPLLPSPRIAYHADEGFTRVALDLPAKEKYSIAVNQTELTIKLPEMRAGAPPGKLEDPDIAALSFTTNSPLTLHITSRHPLSADGKGFRVGLLPPSAPGGSETLYVDFGPGIKGKGVAQADDPPAKLASVRAPSARQRVIVIDPGHGGKFAGTHSPSGFQEQVLTLQIGLKLRKVLEQQGYKVVMTRTKDVALSPVYVKDLQARADMATPSRNLFISIHANSGPPSASGIETWVFGKPLSNQDIALAMRENGGGAVGKQLTQKAQASADAFAGDLLRREQLHYSLSLAHDVEQSLVTATGQKDRGVRQAPLYVLRNARIPAILVETGFLTNPSKAKKLADGSYQEKLVKAIATGIDEFFNDGGSLAKK
jgi:N-acetylmuramoyl-L-alanine amidase